MASSASCVADGSNYDHHHLLQQQGRGGGGDRSRIIGELCRGRDMADQLRLVLRETGSLLDPSALESAVHVPAIVAKILNSFTQSISILCGDSHDVAVGTDEFSDNLVVVPPPARKLEGSGDSCKTTRKGERGCHKRKRSTETWSKESPTWPEDHFAWRKYGQKVILNAKHPRNYFRCTHKYEQGCPATKQVQKIQDDPPVFRAIYHSHHSCTARTTELPYPSPALADNDDSSIIWSFQQPHPVIKQIQSSGSDPNCALLDDHTSPAHQLPPPPPPPPAAAYSSMSTGSDHHGDVYSCTASSIVTLDDFLDI